MDNEEQRRQKLAENVTKRLNSERERAAAALTKEQSDFLNYNNRVGYCLNSELAEDLKSGLSSGKYKRPSEFFDKKCDWLFNGVILPRYKDMFLCAVDRLNLYQYSGSFWRRSFRSSDYSLYFDRIRRLVGEFYRCMRLDKDYCDILALRLPEDELAWANYNSYYSGGLTVVPEAVAYVIDNEPKRAEKIITDILNNENGVKIDANIIRGICMSSSRAMHEYLGKLLVAARLQEGLRQIICESADSGTIEAFLTLLEVIDENNLIRFSSVKRAAGTWTGLMTDESGDLERISGKTIKLIKECIEDEKARERYLRSEDSMEIYISLWAYGFYELREAMEKFEQIIADGSHHQLLTAGYFAANLDNADYVHRAAKKVIEKYSEQDLLAVFIKYFIVVGSYYYYSSSEEDRFLKSISLERFYSDKAEAEFFYKRLWELYNSIPKKSIVFSPCIFPWYSAELKKSDIIAKLCYTAYMLGDMKKIDECCVLIKDCDEYSRFSLASALLKKPGTKLQRKALTDMLADKTGRIRERVFDIVKGTELQAENYIQMEAMLRYKAADIRSHLISLLYDRGEEEVYGTIERLLTDKAEEKRTAGLDMIIKLSKDDKKSDLFKKCKALIAKISKPSTKEKILIESIEGKAKGSDRTALFGEEDRYSPNIFEGDFQKECATVFMRYFPQSEVGKVLYPEKFGNGYKNLANGTDRDVYNDIKSLDKLINEHITDEFVYEGERKTMNCSAWQFRETLPDGKRRIPFYDMWLKWFNEKLDKSPERLMRAITVLAAYEDINDYTDIAKGYANRLYGDGYADFIKTDFRNIMLSILTTLRSSFMPSEDFAMLSAAAEMWFMKAVPDEDVMLKLSGTQMHTTKYVHLIAGRQIKAVLKGSYRRNSKYEEERFALDTLVCRRCVEDKRMLNNRYSSSLIISDYNDAYGVSGNIMEPGVSEYIYMAYRGYITEKTLYYCIFKKNTKGFLDILSNAVTVNREQNIAAVRGGRTWQSHYKVNYISGLLGKTLDYEKEISSQITEDDKKLLAFADKIYENVINEVLSVELTRGDTPTEYSDSINGINRIYGLDNFIAILSALGRDTLERSSWVSTQSKKGSLSHLLSVCIPNPDDNEKKLKKALKGTDITDKRLIEAALYSPEWLDIIEKYLGWNGFKSACYYFMAHMNERFDDRKKAIIAKYTPLTDEELMSGAFDLEWFKAAYKALGEEHFNMVYDAAKYISDGAKHSRARKYADAALGKLVPEETAEAIFDKRNKDLLMAYSLIPLQGEDDLCSRYLNITKFLKESKQFGSQRSASEKKASEIAMQNLAYCAGYADVTRLTLRMETKLIDDSRELFEDKAIEDVVVRLEVSEEGKPQIVCTKGGKTLKSVPAKLKKNEYILRLSETKKKLTEQYRRTKQMFEQAMEDGTQFTAGEIKALSENPVAIPIIKDLVFICGKRLGFINGSNLLDYAGKKSRLKSEDKVVVAHPYALYISGHWADYQRNLFERQIVQPFKQVFRELYIKTKEEAEMTHSLRYAGNQIQPAKTVACLKSRRWVADVEDGLQKVYYKENIVARIYAMADWFSPADIEAPTLEWVEFSNRKTGKELKLSEIPDIIFSEVMRDVDLAVSVAHAGGVDPETSHSTIEMRAALLEFTLPLFKLTNVKIEGHHAYIKGKLAEYTLHLGSGVVHKKGGAMINILPVHSQHRGKLFLPFADDDPKTSEILSKAILLAEDKDIKDPMILEQIK